MKGYIRWHACVKPRMGKKVDLLNVILPPNLSRDKKPFSFRNTITLPSMAGFALRKADSHSSCMYWMLFLAAFKHQAILSRLLQILDQLPSIQQYLSQTMVLLHYQFLFSRGTAYFMVLSYATFHYDYVLTDVSHYVKNSACERRHTLAKALGEFCRVISRYLAHPLPPVGSLTCHPRAGLRREAHFLSTGVKVSTRVVHSGSPMR